MNYLSPEEILYIHNRIIDELDGKHGSNDIMILKKLEKYIHNTEIFPDKFSKAAALFFGIAKKKPFNNKNTETAIATMKIFLQLNKTDIDVSSKEFQDFVRYEFPKAKVEDIRKFLVQDSKPLS